MWLWLWLWLRLLLGELVLAHVLWIAVGRADASRLSATESTRVVAAARDTRWELWLWLSDRFGDWLRFLLCKLASSSARVLGVAISWASASGSRSETTCDSAVVVASALEAWWKSDLWLWNWLALHLGDWASVLRIYHV